LILPHLRLGTWNYRGIALSRFSDPVKFQGKVKYLQDILAKVDILALQEVHGGREDMHEVFKLCPGWLSYCSPCPSPGAGGVALLVHRRLLPHTHDIMHRIILPGRALQVRLHLDTVAINLLCIHVEPAASRDQQCDMLLRALSTSNPLSHVTFILADLNLCMPGDTRTHIHNMRGDEADDALGYWFVRSFPSFVIAEHDGYTRAGVRDGAIATLSRIDYIMVDLPKVTVLDSRFSAYTLGNLFTHKASDHIAVIATLQPPRTSPPNRRTIPSWMSSSPDFKLHLEALIAAHRRQQLGPISRDDLVEIFYAADSRTRTSSPTSPLSAAAKLHWCMVAFRARRQNHQGGILRAQRAFPELPLDDLETAIGELTLQVTDAQLQSHSGDGKKSEAASQAYMQKIALWRQHAPRARFMHIATEQGDIITSDELMANTIRAHWRAVFQGTDDSPEHYLHLKDLTMNVPPATGLSDIPFDDDDITASLRRSDSAPGPDGICYSAWRAAGEAGIAVLQEIAEDMWNGKAPPASFRKSLMVFLPKVDSQAVRPSELRPLALCDSDYKVIMGCINHRLANHLPDYVDDRQRGFMRGRLGLDNLLLLEAASMLACRSGAGSPALCFLDIAAAFPSLLHDFMFQVLDKFLGDHPLKAMITAMYNSNSCDLVVRGQVVPGFRVLCGVRQGCPLSGSLFALTFHPILVSLSDALFKASMHVGHDIFGYADDLALVLYDIWKLLPALDRALQVVAAAAGLHINWKKVQLVPLWRSPSFELIRRRLSATCPRWKPSQITLSAKYLGIQVGPGVSDSSAFAGPLAKYLERCRFIAKMSLGWVRAASLHNIFALPVLSYVAQVQGDEGLREVDLDRAAAILFKHPMFRPSFRFFAHLAELGCDTGLRDVRVECQAAAARCSLTLTSLPTARRHLATGSNDDHLCVHPLRSWQVRCAITRLAAWRERLRHELPHLPGAPQIQRQCRDHLLDRRPNLDYYVLIRDRITPILRRLGDEYITKVESMATFLLETIILASSVMHVSALQALLSLSQNGLVLGQASGTLSCPFCTACQGARLSHFLRCGAIWCFLDEHCQGLGWNFSHPERWQLLLGSAVADSGSAGMLALVWDIIHAGAQAGRFGNDGCSGLLSRLTALSKRSGSTGLLARQLSASIVPDVL
jgi:endonuclease/exonuclease/phosphatase family metal-dependent hydrolase